MSGSLSDAPHIPVLLDEVLDALAICPGETHVDGTFGAGGYTRAMLGRGAKVVAFDRDPDAIANGQALVAVELADPDPPRIFGAGSGTDARVDGVVLDIGVSSMQLDQAERGFSFQGDGPLDMRMAQAGESAADFLNTADEAAIADVLYHYGEEPRSRRVAQAIVAARPLTRTGELAAVVRRALGYRPHDKKDPATRTFQAIRIHVNRELDELADGLAAAERALKPGGRLAVVTFHSLEDRMVKRFFRERAGQMPGVPPSARTGGGAGFSFAQVGKAVRAGEAELARNPRARSATLRFATRTESPAWSAERVGRRGELSQEFGV